MKSAICQRADLTLRMLAQIATKVFNGLIDVTRFVVTGMPERLVKAWFNLAALHLVCNTAGATWAARTM